MGGIGDDYGEGIALDIYGNVFTNGSFESAADFDPGPSVYNLSSAGVSDVFVSRLDNSGLFDWAQRIGGSSSDYSNSIKLDALGNIYVTGSYNSACDFDPGPSFYFLVSNGLRDFYVFKLNVAGSFVWAKSIGGDSG